VAGENGLDGGRLTLLCDNETETTKESWGGEPSSTCGLYVVFDVDLWTRDCPHGSWLFLGDRSREKKHKHPHLVFVDNGSLYCIVVSIGRFVDSTATHIQVPPFVQGRLGARVPVETCVRQMMPHEWTALDATIVPVWSCQLFAPSSIHKRL
jgi:hypothetical protein